ncbi:MAG TPA: VOC family protein [Candidatus Limnocylindrales bacterium]|nr:VOC family protein [Candidatus Limnocylindrales bacterium]
MGLSWHGTVVDAADPARLARWWAQVLGLKVVYERPDVVALPGLIFERVPERKTAKNRLHFELDSDDLGADVEKLLDMGARHVDIGQGPAVGWVVLADPEGNEFCVLPPRRD